MSSRLYYTIGVLCKFSQLPCSRLHMYNSSTVKKKKNIRCCKCFIQKSIDGEPGSRHPYHKIKNTTREARSRPMVTWLKKG